MGRHRAGRGRSARSCFVLRLPCGEAERADPRPAAQRPIGGRYREPDGGVQVGGAQGYDHGSDREGLFRGRDPRDRRMVRIAKMRRAMSTSRRQFLKTAGAVALLPMPAIAQGAGPKVVVIGGGFAGASAARFIKKASAATNVTLVEANPTFTACPFSNGVIAGLRPLRAQQFNYEKVGSAGVSLAFQAATGVDAQGRSVTLANGAKLPYDRLVMAPGIDLRWDGLPGYTQHDADIMPHAWKAGEQTLLLRSQLESMPDGGTVVISAPANPFRCPPGPYERASLIAHYLKTKKPKSKVIILDAKDAFSKQRLFQNAWAQLYPDHLEWVSLSKGGKVNSVDAATKTLKTDFGEHKADVANIIAPQRAAAIAQTAGVADRSGWCS